MSEFQYLSDEDAKQILDQGKISPETYQAILDKAKQLTEQIEEKL